MEKFCRYFNQPTAGGFCGTVTGFTHREKKTTTKKTTPPQTWLEIF